MLGLSRRDWLNLFPILLVFLFISTFRSGAAGLIDPDEPFYALTAKEMLARGEWITPTLFGQPQFEKPILAYWVYEALFKLFGVREWAARLGPSLGALGTLVAAAVLAKALFVRSRAVFLSTALLAASGLFIALSRIVLTDMFLCLFTTASFAAFAYGWKNQPARPVAWRLFFVFMALGFLTKGPLGALLPLGSALIYSSLRGERIAAALPWKSGLLLFAAVAAPWYLLAAARNGWFLNHFFLHENVRRFFVAEHRSMNTPFFYPAVLLLGFFPWSFLVLPAFGEQWSRLGRGSAARRASRAFLLVSVSAMFVFFASASSKLISYIFPLFPLLAVLTGDWLDRLLPVLGRRAAAPSRPLRAMLFAGWIVLPAVLVSLTAAYARRQAAGLVMPVLAAGLLCVVPCAAAYVLSVKGKFRAALAVAAGMSAVFASAAFGWILPMAERFFSSRQMVEDFAGEGFDPGEGTLLASKISARGMSYYSGNPNIAVVAGNRKKIFYTPHPIPMIVTAEDLHKIDAARQPVYGILRPKEIRQLREISASHYDMKILDADAQRSIIRLERRQI